MKEPLYILDGYSLIYRSYFAFIRRPLRSPDGKNTSAVFGFFRSLFSLIQEKSPRYFAVALDSRTPTFRHERYPDYKATREKTPEDLTAQIPIIEEILSVLGVPMIRVDGYEADDIMATVSRMCAEEGRRCYIVSGDKDLLQLVEEPVRVLKPGSGGFEELQRQDVYDHWGVYPEQIRDYLALVGDNSDNIPGVKGIGEKTAVELLGQYPELDTVYENLDEILPPGRQKKLREGRDSALLSRELVYLVNDVPLSVGLEQIALPEIDPAVAAEHFRSLGMHSLVEERGSIRKLDSQDAQDAQDARAIVSTKTPAGADTSKTDAPATETVSTTAATAANLVVSVVSSLDELDSWLRRVRDAGWFAFDSETDSLDPLSARPVGFSLSVAAGEGCYIPLRSPDGPNLPEDAVRERLKDVLGDSRLRMIGQNLKYDYHVLKRWGAPIRNIAFDTMIAAWVLDSGNAGYGMDRLAGQYLGYRTIRYADIVPGAGTREEQCFDTVPIAEASRYAAEDAEVTYRLYQVLSREITRNGLDPVLYEIEMPLVPLLAEMEGAGIGLDSAALETYSGELERDLQDLEQEVYRLCGKEFNLASTKQLQEVLFQDRKLTPVRKTKTGYSTDTAVLQELAREDPVPERILRHRSLSKLKSTYVDALPRMVRPETGRLHTHFNQTGTATGRLSSKDPNLQNIPIRDEEGRRIRQAFVASPETVFVSADYAQIELVVLAHLSKDPGLLDAFRKGKDVHRETGAMIFGLEPEDVTPEQRRVAKTINFGVMYGMSAFRLARDLGIPRREAEWFIETYFARYTGIRDFIDTTVAEAEKTGAVRTLFGRRRVLPDITNRNKTVKAGAERVAVNTPIQGTAADIVKKAMIRVASRIETEKLSSRLLLQVHDELILECPESEADWVERILEEEMQRAVELSVPLRVSVESGRSWGDLH
jgi:DNA polymerase I